MSYINYWFEYFFNIIICYGTILVGLNFYRKYMRNYKIKLNQLIGEDNYQIQRQNSCGNAYIVSFASFSDNEGIKQLNKFKSIQLKSLNLLKEYILKYPLLEKMYLEDVNNYVTNYNNIPECKSEKDIYKYFKPNLMAIINIPSKNTVGAILNHVYLGGSFFVKLGEIFTNGKFPGLHSNKTYLLYPEHNAVKFLFMNYIPNKIYDVVYPHKLLSISNNIKRYTYNFNLELLKTKYLTHKKSNSLVIYQALSNIINFTNKNKLKICLTYAFEHDEVLYNNVGCIFFEFYKNQDLELLEKCLKSNSYQILATNTLMQCVQQSKNARKNVDVVFTMMYIKNSYYNGNKYYNSFLNVADYPIYVFGVTVNNISHITNTIMTEEFDYDKAITTTPNSYCYEL
jgi:hypothetical protein